MSIYTDPLSILPKGSYEISKLLGKGALGSVYLAKRTATGEWVALKVLQLPSIESLKRLEREVRVMKTLHGSPFLVNFIEAHFSRSQQTAVLVSEWVNGPSLENLVEIAGKGMPENLVLAISKQLTEGVAALHDQGILHRDIKPSNVLITLDGTVKIADFGLVIPEEEAIQDSTITLADQFVGTLRYTSPEIVEGQKASKSSDLYSLGLTILFSIYGHPPFENLNLLQLVRSITSGQLIKEIPESFTSLWKGLFNKLLSPDPAKRLRTAHDLKKLLDESFQNSSSYGAETVSKYLHEIGAKEGFSIDPPRPIIGGISTNNKNSVDSLLQTLNYQINKMGSAVTDRTATFSRGDFNKVSTREPEAFLSEFDTRIDKTFDSIRDRLRFTWRIGLIMTLVLFGVFVSMISLAVIFGLVYRQSSWSIIFGSSSVLSLLTVVIWKPMDKMLLTTIATQQLELIQLNYQRALNGTREERREAFKDVSQQLDGLMVRLMATSGKEKK